MSYDSMTQKSKNVDKGTRLCNIILVDALNEYSTVIGGRMELRWNRQHEWNARAVPIHGSSGYAMMI